MNLLRSTSARRLAVLAVVGFALIVLPGTSLWATAGSVLARTAALARRAVAPAFGMSAVAPPPGPAIAATMTATIATDGGEIGKAGPGDAIRYSTTITNSGTDATGVHFNDTIASGTMLVGGSIVISPLAYNDSYTSVGNMTLTTSSIAADCAGNSLRSVTCNDTFNGGTLTKFGDTQAHAGNVTVDGTNTVTTIHSGTVKLNTDGSFVYDPAAGYEGDDEFYYTLTNTTTTPNLTDVGKVTITVGGANGMVWFVNSTGVAGSGTQKGPFNSLAAFTAVNNGAGTNPAAGDTIYLFENGTSYTGSITLLASQKLIGQDATLSPASLNAPALKPGNAYPAINPGGSGIKVTITSSGAGVPTVILNSGNTLAGFTAGHTSGSFAISGGTAGSLSLREVTINSVGGGGFAIATSAAIVSDATFGTVGNSINTTAGPAIDLNGVSIGAGGLAFSSVSSAGGANGVKLASVTGGPVALGTGSLTATAAAFLVGDSIGTANTGGTAVMTYGGTITTTGSARPVNIQDRAAGAGNITLSGTITHSTGNASGIFMDDNAAGTIIFSGANSALNGGTSPAVSLTDNTGATINFTGGGLDIDTTSGAGFVATGGGTVSVTGTLNTIVSTTGTALNVANTTIGGTGLTFKSISANGAPNGIVLNNTGGGQLTVTGDGNTSQGGNSSGGVIQHTTTYGISLTSTQSPSFTNVTIHDIGRNGIFGTGVVNFTFDNGQITNTGTSVAGQYEENAIAFVDAGLLANTVSGNVVITDSLISGAHRNAIMIETWNGTISNINISNNSLTGATNVSAVHDSTLSTTADVQDAIHVFSQGSASTTAHIATGTINNNTISGFEFFSSPIFIGGNGIRVAGGSGNASNSTTATLGTAVNPIEISGNDVDNVGSNSIAASFNGQQGISHFNIHDNGTPADPMSNAEGLGISVFFGGSGTFSASVTNNAVDNNGPTVNAGSAGIAVQLDDGPAGLANATGVATIHVNNNNVTNPDGFGIRGIVRASNGTLNLYIQNNNVGTPSAANREAIRVDSGSAAGDTTLNLNMTGNSGPLASTTDDLVGSGIDAGIGVRKQGTTTTVNEFNLQGISASPTNAQVQAFIGGNNHTADGTGGSVNGVDIISGSNYGTTNAVPLLAAAGGVEAARVSRANGGALAQSDLDLIVPAARSRWARSELTADQLAALRRLALGLQDLADRNLGASNPGHVAIGVKGAGYGWFVDTTPDDDAEFPRTAAATRLYTTPQDAPAGRLDLLTAVLHEMGHELGLADSYADADRDSLMYGRLTTGERRLPSSALLAALASSSTGVLRQALSLFRQPDRRVRHQSHDIVAGLPRGPSIAAVSSIRAGSSFNLETRLRAASQSVVDAAATVARGVLALTREAADALVLTLHASGETVDVPIGALPAGKSVTVVFSVTVDTPPVASYANHATIGSTTASFSDVDSNTVTTPGDRYSTTTSVGSSKSPAEQGETVTFTATVTPSEGSTTPDGTLDFNFGDSNTASGIACTAAAGNTCTAQVTHAFAAGGVYQVNASYQGGTNHDPSSTTSPFSQTITSCGVNPIVISNADDGPGTLRQALVDACHSPGFNTITFDMNAAHPSHVTSPITLTSGELPLTKDVVINGPGASALTVTRDSGAGFFRIFHNQPGVTATISGLTVSNGSVVPVGGSFDRDGGAILNQEGTLTLQSMVVTGNSAYGYGSGVLNGTENFEAHATMTILDSTITGNGNGGTGPGGGVANYAGGADSTLTMTIRRSTITGNGSGGEGGAIRNEPFRGNIVVTATDTTFSGNSSAGNGGAIANMTGAASTSQVTLTNCTITGNQANVPAAGGIGGGIYNQDTVTLRNTIVAGNNNGDVVGTVTNSFNNLIGNGDGAGGLTNGVDGNLVGTGETPIDPRLGPLANNGGPTQTHALLTGSPAIDAGDDSYAFGANDQRGAPFARIRDGADADTTAKVDIGALEAVPTIEDITDKSVIENQVLPFSFNLGDAAVGFDSIVAASRPQDQALIPNANLVITGSGSSRTLTITPAAGQSGTAIVTVTASKTINGTLLTATDTFNLTVVHVNHAPTIDPIGNPAAIPEDSGEQTVNLTGVGTGGEIQALTVTATSNNPALIPDPLVLYSSPDATGSLKYTPVPDAFGSAIVTVTVHDDGGTALGGVDTTIRTFTVMVNPVADTPSITPATTSEDTQSTSGLVVTKNPADGAEVAYVKITNIANGTLYQNNGSTPIGNGAFITFVQAAAGLKFTPSPSFFGTGSFDIQASTSNSNAGLGGAVVPATITVTPVADTPSVTNATTPAQVQTTSGLVITPNAADGAEVTHFRITNIQHGALFQNDGATPINAGDFIAVADGAPGLKFTPADGFSGSASFDVQASTAAAVSGLGGGIVTATITVTAYSTTTHVFSANPNPSDKTQPITVVYSVTNDTPGPAPTGTVTVTISGGGETCTGTVAEGQCTLTPLLAGSRTITATYNPDGIHTTSSGTLGHLVNNCSIDPVVLNTNPFGAGSLVDAVGTACFGNTVTFSIPGPGPHTITLASFTLDIAKDLTIRGSSDGIRISGNHFTAILVVELNVNAVLDGLTLMDGSSVSGGALTNYGTLTIRNSTLTGNSATVSGGAIQDSGALTIVNSTLSGNTVVNGSAGAIDSSGGASLTLTHVTITNNSAGGAGSFGGGVVAGANATIANSIVAGNMADTSPDVFGSVLQSGNNLLSGNPMLGPLQDNGGPTFTHMPLAGSPALDAGDTGVALSAGLTTDQRGVPFARILDAADADPFPAVDLGAVEADPVVEVLTDKTIDEDGSVVVTFNVGDATTPFDSVVAVASPVSGDPGLLPNTPANVDVSGFGTTRTLTLTPASNLSGSALVTVTATKMIGGAARTSTTSFTLTVNAVNDPPTLNPIAPVVLPEDAPLQTVNLTGISAGGGENQFLIVTATSDNTALIPNPTVNYFSPNLTGSLTFTPAASLSGTATITVTVTDSFGPPLVRTFTVTVGAVADTPSITNATTNEDTQTTSGLVITRNAADGAEVTHAKVLSVTGGTLFQHDGTTPIAPGSFITIAEGGAGLRFTPAPNSFATGHVTVQASIGALDAGLGGAPVTADVQVNPVPDTPTVTPATTPEDTQTSSGLVITRNAADGPEVTQFKILDISNGTLFQNDGTTQIHAGDVISKAQGGAGLRFTPAPNFFGIATFHVIGALDPLGGFNGTPGIGAGVIDVTPVADTPTITNATTIVNAQTTSGLVVSRNAADGAEVTHVKVTAVSGGTLFLNDGFTAVGAGTFITIAQGAAGLKFTPTTNSAVTGHVSIQASTSNADAGLGGSIATADIIVNLLPSTTVVATSGSPSQPNQFVFFTATVTPALAGASGTVQFKDGGNNLGTPVALSSGTATASTSTLTPGLHTITAVYSGNSLAAASTGTLAGGQFVRIPVTVSSSSSANPTPLAQPVTITITVTPTVTGSGTPTGFVAITENTTTLGSVALTGGTASFTSSSLTLGVHHLLILYNSDATFAPGGVGFDQTISCPVMTVGPATIPPAVIGLPYSQTFTQSGGVGAVAFSLTGTLPSGLTFTAASATLSGVPIGPGSYPITVTATPANGCGAVSVNYTLLVGGGRTVLTGASAGGGPVVRRFAAIDGSAPTSGALSSFFAFDPLFTGGVRVAEGDVNGDGQPDYIAASGPGAPPQIKIFDGATGAVLRSFFAFEPAFTGGVFVAAGDVDGDGYADVIAGSGPGRSGEVKVFSGRDGSVLRDTAVFSPAFTGGVRVAAGDVNGDGAADLVVGSGEGMPATVMVLSGTDLSVLRSFTPYAGFPFGVWVAAGDVTGDGFADVITGADAGGGPHVKVFDGVTGAEVRSFFAFAPTFTGGVRVAAGDVTGDGKAEIIVGAGSGGAPEVRVFDGATSALVSSMLVYPVSFTGGVFVATAAPQHRMTIEMAGRGGGGGGSAAGPGGDRRPDMIAGWAFVENFHDAGISAIHVWALPVGGGAPVFIGVGTLGDARPDIAARFGQQYANAGFHLDISRTVPRGTYDIAVFAQSALTGTFEIVRVVRVTLTP